jgi:hypothetical protein
VGRRARPVRGGHDEVGRGELGVVAQRRDADPGGHRRRRAVGEDDDVGLAAAHAAQEGAQRARSSSSTNAMRSGRPTRWSSCGRSTASAPA